MAAVRRSTRLSSVGKASLASPTTHRQNGIWQHRNSKNSSNIQSDEEEEELLSNCSNEENCNQLNKMKQVRRAKTQKNTEIEEMKTPKSKKNMRKPMPASKKMELLKRQQSNESKEENSSDDDTQQASPPKQSRGQANNLLKHVISPSRLLDRLSLDERPDQLQSPEVVNKSPRKEKIEHPSTRNSPVRSKYQNARRVLNSAVCDKLPGREDQLEELRTFFREHLETKTSGSLYVSGQPGTGKTACLSLLLRSPEFNKRLQTVYVNCTSIASTGGVYKKLCSELDLKPQGRTERDHLQALQHYLKTCPKMLLIVLDEIDQLCSSKQSVLYTIFEWPSMPDVKLLLVGIANSLDLTERTLLRLNARCELKPKHMHFPPYSKQQIVDIFKSRLEEADVLDIFPPATLQLLAGKVSAVSGDVRRALDIGRRVVEIAEQHKSTNKGDIDMKALKFVEQGNQQTTKEEIKPVQITQVATVLNKVYGASQNLQEDMDESFPLQQKIMLCTLMLMLRNEKNKDITMGRLHEVYRRVCTKRNIYPVDQAEFVSLVDLVQTRGILRIVKKKEPRLSKVQLQWDEDEVNGALRDKQLIASILDDTACLEK